MRAWTLRMLWLAAWLAGAASHAGAAAFVPPAEGPVAFRRDRIPLDVEAMSALSRQLESFADDMAPENARDFRSAAQMLALSLALDPANNRARRVLEGYEKGRHDSAAGSHRGEKNRGRIWQAVEWLESTEAGTDARALASCLKDVLAVVDADHPKAEAIRQAGEKGAWASWVPPLSAYEAKQPDVASNDVPKQPDENSGKQATLKLAQARVGTVLFNRTAEGDRLRPMPTPAPLEMTASKVETEDEEQAKFSITIGPEQEENPYEHACWQIKKLLHQMHGELPKKAVVKIGETAMEHMMFSEKRRSVSAAAAVLASAAITGTEPDAIILGEIGENGEFKLPMGFWDQLQSLGKGMGRRLVLPADAAAYLPSILALEKPEFFLQYEVLLASDFKQVLELSAKNPPGTAAPPITKFHEVQERAGAGEIRQYIANPYVRQRLVSIFQECPLHFSAKMLLIQAAGQRPTQVPRNIFAAEVRRAMDTCSWLVSKDNDMESTDAPNLVRTFDNTRAKLDALERYADRKDRDLTERARTALIGIRAIEKGLKARGEYVDNTERANSARYDFRRTLRDFYEALGTEMGEGQAKLNH